ncbi:MAG: hypothetical protein K2P23_03855, partial [Lachnospiraceae bacterium]|nr:hypothetical protein [Lachnospiraceae bacterium]
NAYYNYYAEYRNHAHTYEHDYEEKREKELEKERQEWEEFNKSYKKLSFEEMEERIRNTWEKEKMTDRKPSQAMFFTTEIADRDKYVEAYKKEKEALELKNCLTPFTRAEEEAFLEKEWNKPRDVKMSSYDFMNNTYSYTGDNVYYWIEGVRFSKDEYEGCRSVIQQAKSLLTSDVTLDYINHALIGLAYNVVNTYAEENLTWDQREVISQSVAAHFDTYILQEQEYFIKEGVYVDSNDKYHAIRDKNGGRYISATNEEAIEALRSIFGGVDLRDQKAVDKAYGQYLSIVGITGSFRVDSNLKTSLSNAQTIIKNAGKKVDYSI